jgi:hypothetical protein
MRFTILAILFITAFPLLLLATQPVNKSTWKGIAIKGYDCVSYHIESKAVKGKKDFSAKHLGATWLFSSKVNRDKFINSPQTYLPQYNGFCAWAMANGYKAKIDPESFAVIEKKLYLNYNKDIQSKWEEDQTRLISLANLEWKKLTSE